MSIKAYLDFNEGKSLWYEYVRINGYSFCATEKGISRLSKILDLDKRWIAKHINQYLEA